MHENITMAVILILLVVSISLNQYLLNKLKESQDKELKHLDKQIASAKRTLAISEERLYLVKSINDSFRVTDPRGFLVQRMKNMERLHVDKVTK